LSSFQLGPELWENNCSISFLSKPSWSTEYKKATICMLYKRL